MVLPLSSLKLAAISSLALASGVSAQDNGTTPAPLNPGVPIGMPTAAANITDFNAKRTLYVGYIVYPGFELLDAFGPLEIIFQLSWPYKISLAIIAEDTGPVPAGSPAHLGSDFGYMIAPQVQATHTFLNTPALDVLFVPGGLGISGLEESNNSQVEDFIERRYPQVNYLVSICTGALLVAKSGVLDGRKATTNKAS